MVTLLGRAACEEDVVGREGAESPKNDGGRKQEGLGTRKKCFLTAATMNHDDRAQESYLYLGVNE